MRSDDLIMTVSGRSRHLRRLMVARQSQEASGVLHGVLHSRPSRLRRVLPTSDQLLKACRIKKWVQSASQCLPSCAGGLGGPVRVALWDGSEIRRPLTGLTSNKVRIRRNISFGVCFFLAKRSKISNYKVVNRHRDLGRSIDQQLIECFLFLQNV